MSLAHGAADAGRGPRPGVGEPPPAPAMAARYQRLAWAVIGTAFVLFCLLVVTLLYGATNYSQRSSQPRPASVQLAHGTKLEIQRAGQKAWNLAPETAALAEGDAVRTGQDTDAWITLFDQSTLHLYYSSTVILRNMRSSRFLNQFKEILVEQTGGTISLAAGARAPYGSDTIQITTADRQNVVSVPENSTALVGIVDPPEDDLHLKVSALLGKVLVRKGNGPRLEIPLGEMCRISTDGTILGPMRAANELIENGGFRQAPTNSATEIAYGWRLSVRPAGAVPIDSRVVSETLGGQTTYAARFKRALGARDTATVAIRQDLDKAVNYYQSIQVSAAVKIVAPAGLDHALAPLTLRVTYEDLQGQPGIWQRQFYLLPPVVAPGPEFIPLDTDIWTEFPTADIKATWDLMAQSPPPNRIKAVEIIVVGTAFDAWVTGLSLDAH